MKTFLIQGVPPSVSQDGWWLSSSAPSNKQPTSDKAGKLGAEHLRLGLLILSIALGDVLVWQVLPGLSLAVFGAALIIMALIASGRKTSPTQLSLVAGLSLLVLMPLVELVQPLSLLVSFAGLSMILALIAGLHASELLRGARRLWPLGVQQTAKDAVGLFEAQSNQALQNRAQRMAFAWLMPLVLGAIFILLLADANPVLLDWIERLPEVNMPNPARVAFWLCLVPLGWTVLSLIETRERLRRPAARKAQAFRPVRQGFINQASVTRALLLFNVVFALQTVMDIVYLYGGVGLPEGITYAQYAHRGAYPLLVTALLAGGFALVTRKWVDGDKALRLLLMIWIAQNVALVVSSLVRLDLYVDIYGLTHLRMAAAIWMALVATGLALVIWQIWRGHANAWMLNRSAVLGVGVLYLSCFISFDAVIARHNLSMPVQSDTYYLCRLGDAAKPIIAQAEQRGRSICPGKNREIVAPADWREWGFRNWRARRSLDAVTAEVAF
ncbi:DUF4173 domain-containing protein [Sulfitobacter sp. SK012]|uniref:DUF4153 domain-containing protein n=1 Tax=Sulfitobacter sp. SK012 TaxID=1389005 RepID=UPI000E0A39B6|nr:DUF4173 domain-containing protein [Sulfitobacter sp. SK012]AXI48252.1 DUF4173 domain-containing protein [Sulfitobacter sp. SK012]